MITSFDGNVWYLQLYDCDSCLGLDNSGALKFDSDIEVEAGVFNTSNSRLWEKLRRNFPTQILAQWEYLRLNEFTEENIMKYLVDNISDKIPEINYNLDAWKKYINLGQELLFACHGNRRQQIQRWIKERIIYVDTLLQYTVSTNDYVTVRVNKMGEVSFDIQAFQPMYFSIKFRNEAGGTITKRISRGETVRFSYNIPVETDQEILVYGGRFIKDLGDLSDMNPTNLLLGNATRLTKLKCTNADRLINASISGCVSLQEVDLHNCSNLGAGSDASLQTLDLSACRNLRTVNIYGTQLTALYTSQQGGIIQEILYPYSIQIVRIQNQARLTSLGIPCYYTGNYNDERNIFAERLSEMTVSNCPNVKTFVKNYYVNEDGSEVSIPTFIGVSKGRTFNLSNVMSYLTQIDLSYCSNIESLTLDNFNNLLEINFDDIAPYNATTSNLHNLTLTNCPNVETLTFNQNTVNGENSLGVAFKEGTVLDLSGLYNLKHIRSNVGIKGLKKLILPLTIQSLVFDYPKSTTYAYGESDIEDIFSKNALHETDGFKGIDLLDIETITDFSMGSLTKINNAINLEVKITDTFPYINYFKTDNYFKPEGTIDISEYKGSLEYLFKGVDLDKLTVVCSEPLPHTSAKYMFAYASGENVEVLNILFSYMPNVTDFSYMFYYGYLKHAPLIPTRAENVSYMFYNNETMETTPSNWLQAYPITPISDYCYTGCSGIIKIDDAEGSIDVIPVAWGGFDRKNAVISGETIIVEQTLEREFVNFTVSGQTFQNIVPEVGQTPTLIANKSSQSVGEGMPTNILLADGVMPEAELEGFTLANLASEKRSSKMTCNQTENDIRAGLNDTFIIEDGGVVSQLELDGLTLVNIMPDTGKTPLISNNDGSYQIDKGLDEGIILDTGKMLSSTLYGETIINLINEGSNKTPLLTLDLTNPTNSIATIETELYEDYEKNIKIQDGGEIKSAILKGNTLVNYATMEYWNSSNVKVNQENNMFMATGAWGYWGFSVPTIIGKKYFVSVKSLDTDAHNKNIFARENDISGTDVAVFSAITDNYMIFTATTTTTFIGNRTTINNYTHIIDSPIIVKYQEGMENWDTPYFEGMQSVKMPVLMTFNRENMFKYFTNNVASTFVTYSDLKFRKNYGSINVKHVPSPLTFGYTQLISSVKMDKGTYKFTCKIKVQNIGDTYKVVVNKFYDMKDKVATSLIETIDYVGYVSSSINETFMYLYSWNEKQVEYYDIMITKISNEDITTTYVDDYKTNILTVNEDVTLRSNGDVYDELNLLTGRLTQRIDENNEVLSQEVVKTVDLKCTNQDDELIDKCCVFANGHISISSDTLIPTLEYSLPTTNYYELNSLQSETNYTLRFDGEATSGMLGGSTINTVNDTLVATSATDNILYLDGDVSNVMLLEGNYVGRDIPYFTGMRSVEGVEVETSNSDSSIQSTIQLPPHIQLHSLPDGTRDEVDIKTGILIRKASTTTFDGSENWQIISNFIYLTNGLSNYSSLALSDSDVLLITKEEITGDNKVEGVYIAPSTGTIRIRKKGITDNIDTFKNYLKSNPLSINVMGLPAQEKLILNYNHSCDYGRILPTGMCDKYDVVNSMYTQTMASILLDGANTWDAMEEFENTIKFTATGTTVGVEELNMLGAGGLYCDNDLFPNINDDSDVEHCRVDEAGNKFYIYISKDRLMSPDLIGWQIWLQANPFNLIYELAEHLTYVKQYEELDATQARWEGMDCMRDGTIKYHANNEDNLTIYPTLEYVAPSINNFEVPMLEPNTDYTIYAEGINTNDTINLGGNDINFNNGTVYTSGDNQWLRIDNNDSFYNMVITKGDTTGEVVPYFEGMTSIENPAVYCGDTKNLFDGKFVFGSMGSGGLEYTENRLRSENYIPIQPNTKYTITCYSGYNVRYVAYYDENKSFISETSFNSYNVMIVTTPSNNSVKYMLFNCAKKNTSENFTLDDLRNTKAQVELGGVSTEYTPQLSEVSYTDLKLRSLPNGVKDTINVVTGEYVQRVGEREYQDGDLTNENVLTDGINTMYELENYTITKLDAQTLLAYADVTINLSSDTGLLPTTHYTVPSTNTFHLPSMKTGTRYTLKYPSASGSITIGDINYKISSDSMLFTTPLKINGDTSAIIFSDTNPENVVLLEGAYNTREVPYFTGVKSVKNPNITIIDQLSTESTTYNCGTEIELRGLPNGVADKLDIIKGKLTTNVGIRPYQEGDENLPNIWTDGYETVYALSSPIVTNVAIDHPTVTTNSLIELSSDYLIPQLNYRAPSSNNFPLDLLQPNTTYTLYADTLVSGSYTLGGTKTGVYSQPHTITLGDMTDNLLTFNGDLGLSNVMLVKGNSLKTTLPPYFLGIRSVTDGHLLIEGMAGEMNEITIDEGIVLRDCNGVKDTIDLITCTLTKRTGEITLTGAERWSILPNVTINDDLQIFTLTLSGINSSINNGLVCDKFIHKHMSGKPQDTESIYSTNNQLILVVKKSRIGGDAVNALKSWLNQNPTTVIYPLITQLEIPLENVWTTTPPTSYDNQTEISSTVSSTSLKPMISVTIATTTLEEIVSNLEARNEELENENIATMLALTNIYETFAMPMATNETSTIDLSDGKDGNKINGMSVSPIGMIYAKLIKKGYKTIEQVPTNLQAEVKYTLKGLE